MADGQKHQALPEPHANLHLKTIIVPAGTVMHRIFPVAYQSTQFNPGQRGNARFSPFTDAAGNLIPTLYAGSTFECAAMETVFHDVPYAPGLKTMAKGKLEDHLHAEVRIKVELTLIDLTNKALRKLGVTRTQLIETEKDQYPVTRLWAQAIHSQYPEAQGLYWVSRQDDTAVAIVLFGDRVPAGAINQEGQVRNLLDDEAAYNDLLDLADVIGLLIVPDK